MKPKPVVEKDTSMRWLLTYADMVSCLLVFFIVLYAMANVDQEKFEKLVGSLASAFNGLGTYSGQSNIDRASGQSIMARFSAAKVEQSVTRGGGIGSGGGTRTKSKILDDFQYISNRIDEVVTAHGLEDKVSVERSSEGIVVNLAGDLLFLTTRADLRPESYFVLDTVAELVQPLTNHVRIDGHTDSIPPQNDAFPTNWHLSGARALAVLQFMEQFGRIDRARLHYSAWADLKPVGDNSTLSGRLQNRRASIVILYPDKVAASSAESLNPATSTGPTSTTNPSTETVTGLPAPRPESSD